MQHDTSPHRVEIGGRLRLVQTASLVCCSSRMLFFQFFPTFRRFDCKVFLTDALKYLPGAWSSPQFSESFTRYVLTATFSTLSLAHAYKIPHMFLMLGIADSPTFPAAGENVGAFRHRPTAPARRNLGPASEVRRYDAAISESRSAAPSTQGAIKFGDTDNSTFFQLAEGSVMAEMVGIPETAKRVKLDRGTARRHIARVADGHSSAIAALFGRVRTASLPPTIPSPSTRMDKSCSPLG